MKAHVYVGISCSGKSTEAERFISENPEWVEINRDNIRFSHFCNGERNWGKYKFKNSNEKLVTEIFNREIDLCVENQRNLIISDTNLNTKYRNALIRRLEEYGYEVEIKEFEISLDEAFKRDTLRCNGVGREVIYKQWLQWLEYKERRKYKIPSNITPNTILVDCDGTVADMTGVRKPYEWGKVGLDFPIITVIEIVCGLHDRGYDIVFLSGRDSVCREQTEKWLKTYFNFPFDLYMRKEGDNRKDTIIKEEIFWENIADSHTVCAVMDDRPSVCRMWRELGLKVIQVGDPYIEF